MKELKTKPLNLKFLMEDDHLATCLQSKGLYIDTFTIWEILFEKNAIWDNEYTYLMKFEEDDNYKIVEATVKTGEIEYQTKEQYLTYAADDNSELLIHKHLLTGVTALEWLVEYAGEELILMECFFRSYIHVVCADEETQEGKLIIAADERLKKLQELGAPTCIIEDQKKSLLRKCY